MKKYNRPGTAAADDAAAAFAVAAAAAAAVASNASKRWRTDKLSATT